MKSTHEMAMECGLESSEILRIEGNLKLRKRTWKELEDILERMELTSPKGEKHKTELWLCKTLLKEEIFRRKKIQ